MESNNSSSALLKTDGGKTKSNAIEVPSISLPKGGGAIKGIDEKFSVNTVNGTASFSIPLPFSPARGASPSLSVSYNSGSGNGIFGLGWNLEIASVKIKTDKGLPQYNDSDVYLFSGAEDLVPEFKKKAQSINGVNRVEFEKDHQGDYIINESDSPDGLWTKRYYRPRIEGLFARIERWTNKATGIFRWRVTTRDNVNTLFGWTKDAVIADPLDARHIYEWLPEFVYDDKGNCCRYLYKPEDKVGLDVSQLHNRNRLNKDRKITYTNRYLDRILYGNLKPYVRATAGDNFPDPADFVFETVFDYGTLKQATDTQPADPVETLNLWDFRKDAFSDYKAGFEIRTTRLCKRVLLFHHFKGENEYDGLVKSLDFEYSDLGEEGFTFLQSITSRGHIKKIDGSYSTKRLPPMSFEYQKHHWNTKVKSITSEDLINAPSGLDEPQYQLTDLFNEGLSGILTEQGNGWYYKHNLGDGQFEEAKLVSPKPSFTGMGAQLHLADLDADGGKQLVSYASGSSGYFELDDDNEWQPFRNFRQMPNIDFGDPNTRMLDLNGDGKAEVVITEDSVFTWYPSEGREGYSQSYRTLKPSDEEAGPYVVFSDPKQTIYLADMSGDGMTDIVRIRNGEICYWPNLGYGKFGAKVGMDHSPVFDHPDSFNPSHLRLADIDGSGTTDIIYLGKNNFSCWMNQSGNSFSEKSFEIEAFPEIHNHAKITVADLLGNGVACIVWSSPLTKDATEPLKYIDLMGSVKPHIMKVYKNNLGKEVTLTYKPSTHYYLEDKKAGNPWITKLHFPIYCISETVTEDKISGWKFKSSYTYHHGYYDHVEREFRGFGRVDQIDSESFEHWVKSGATNITEKDLHQDPVLSRSWVHTGAFLRKEKILSQFEKEYWHQEIERQFNEKPAHPEADLPGARIIPGPGLTQVDINTISTEEWREALRACKGMGLRSEVFALDAPEDATKEQLIKQLLPFSVATHNCVIELIQPRGKNRHAVFVVKESEAITYSYERNPEDPRIAHMLNIALDEYGNVLEAASVVYPRSKPDAGLPLVTQAEQAKTVIIYSQNHFTNDVGTGDSYRLRLPSEVKTFELKGVPKSGFFYKVEDFDSVLIRCTEVDYAETESNPKVGSIQKRLIEHVRSTFYRNDLSGPLALHSLESLALPFESYQLAYTQELLDDIFTGNGNVPGSRVYDGLLKEGKFTHSEGDESWWIRSGTSQFIEETETAIVAQNRFYLPVSYLDPYGTKTEVIYDQNYFLFIEETKDHLGNTTRVEHFNFRLLSAQRMRDINDNLTEALADELGLVKVMAVFGKGTEADDLQDHTEFATPEDSDLINLFLQIPETSSGLADSFLLHNHSKELLGRATGRFVYDFETYQRTGKPTVVASIVREQHFKDNPDSPVQVSFEYSGGLGKVVMKKAQAEPGMAKKMTVNEDGSYQVVEVDTSSPDPMLRWVGNGRTVLNNKGNAVKQFEPYFSVTPAYENLKELVETGVTPVMFYDAMGRPVKTEMPDGTFSRTEFDSWKQLVFDANDTVTESEWYKRRTDNSRPDFIRERKEQSAASKASLHANTPTALHFDSLGRPVLQIENNGKDSSGKDLLYKTKIFLDVEGNLRKVTDARELPENGNTGNVVMRYKYDMLGNLVYQKSMDAGQRWLLFNALGKPLRTWDERNHEFQYFYDELHRPVSSKVLGGDGTTSLDHIFDRIEYGESLLETGRTNESILKSENLLGKVIRHYDTGGLIDTPKYDFKGQPLSTTRYLFKNYKGTANWVDANLIGDLEGDPFTFKTETDALGRITRQEAPDGSVITPGYNDAGLLNSEKVRHAGTSQDVVYIKDIDYNEKGQRNKILYGNDVATRFEYDRETFRLTHLESKRKNRELLQDLYYTYDPVGNITTQEDFAQPVRFFSNTRIEPKSEYTYDALYRLVEANGRENNKALVFGNQDNWNDQPFIQQLNPGDPLSIRAYTQRYRYDAVGNILEMKHLADGGNWTRTYSYETGNNRLKNTRIGDSGSPANYTAYAHHPTHGFMTTMPHLEEMGWNFKEELVKTIRQKVDPENGTPETTYYQYDGQGQRIRKITENEASAGYEPVLKNERIYIAGYELYKSHSGSDEGLQRTSLSLMDEGHRFVMVDTETEPRQFLGIPIGRTSPIQTVRYQLHNHLGSASIELEGSPDARIISYEEYHPFGTTAYQARNASINAAAKRYRYTGMERDEETGLEYHSARYYLPWLGRWLSADPIGIGDGVNVYRYCKGNPVAFKDGRGTQATPPPPQLHLIEQFNLETRATGSGFSQQDNFRIYTTNLALQFGENPSDYQVGHHPSTPQWSTPPGGRQLVGPQHYLANLAQSLQERADRQAATTTPGAYFRTDRTHTGPPMPNPPPTVLSPGVRDVIRWTPPNNSPAPTFSLPAPTSHCAPRLNLGPVQLSFPFAEQDQLSFNFNQSATAPSPTSIPTAASPAVQLSLNLETTTQPNARPATAPSSPSPSPDRSSPGSRSGGSRPSSFLNPAANASALRTVGYAVPGVAETEAALLGGAYLASGHAASAPLVAPLMSAAETVPVVAGVGVVGALTGHAAREGATALGASSSTAETIGFGTAVATGAALGSFIPGVGTAVGAGVGALVAGGFYLLSR